MQILTLSVWVCLSIYIANKFTDDASAVGLWKTLRVARTEMFRGTGAGLGLCPLTKPGQLTNAEKAKGWVSREGQKNNYFVCP